MKKFINQVELVEDQMIQGLSLYTHLDVYKRQLCGCYFIDTAYPMRAHFISQTAARAAVKAHNPNFPRPESWPGAFFRCGSLKVRRAALAFPCLLYTSRCV